MSGVYYREGAEAHSTKHENQSSRHKRIFVKHLKLTYHRYEIAPILYDNYVITSLTSHTSLTLHLSIFKLLSEEKCTQPSLRCSNQTSFPDPLTIYRYFNYSNYRWYVELRNTRIKVADINESSKDTAN